MFLSTISPYRYELSTKTPVRRVDSGPATDSQRFDSSNYKYPMSNIDVVLVNSTQSPDQNMSRASAPAAVGQSKSRRDAVPLNTGDELNSNYQSQHHNYQNVAMKTSPQQLMTSQNYAHYGKGHGDDLPGKMPVYTNTPKGLNSTIFSFLQFH